MATLRVCPVVVFKRSKQGGKGGGRKAQVGGVRSGKGEEGSKLTVIFLIEQVLCRQTARHTHVNNINLEVT